MKKSIILLTALLSLVGCANNNNHRYVKDYRYVDALKTNGITKTDLIKNASAEVVSFHGPVFNEENINQSVYVIKSIEEANSFVTFLKEEQAFGDLTKLPYENINYFVSNTLSSSSSGYSYVFKGLYLKNNTIYTHLEYDSREEKGVGVTMDMKYQYCHFTLDKSISFTDAKVIVSYYE